MSHQQPAQEAPDLSVGKEPLPPFITESHRVALERLARSFAEARPLAILIGEGKSGASFVISSFLADIKGDVAVVRITEPCLDATVGMREVIHAIGFDPKDMSVADLENVFTMFLSFQKTHQRRTIICIEEAQDNGQWVLDRVRRLVELEIKGKFGLMVILAGRPTLSELLNEPPLNAICAKAGNRIALVPFTMAETKEYIRRRVEGAGAVEIDQVFEFEAVTAIQKLSSGVPDDVCNLYSKCLELANLENIARVTMALVERAAKLLQLASIVQPSITVSQEVEGEVDCPSGGRLIAFVNDTFAQEQTLNGGHVLIGRDNLCDIRLTDAVVSRHHALVVNSSIGVKLVDLGSRNGTFVNGCKIKRHTLQDNDKITVGDCSIEFVAGDDHHSRYFDTDPTDVFEPHIAGPAPPGNGNGFDRESLDSTRTKISSLYRGARN